MARVTVEDCLENVDNRFELIMVSTKRSRQLATGGKDALVDWEGDKPTVVALREIAAGLVDASILDDQEELQQEFEEIQSSPELIAETMQTSAMDDEQEVDAASPNINDE